MSAELANVTLADDTVSLAQKICYLNGIGGEGNDYDGRDGVRVSAVFVILATSSFATFFPVLARRVRWFRIPLYGYLFARYFGAGVIIATAFIHLMDPAYSSIGPGTCVGVTSGWDSYSFVPAIMLTSVMLLFLLDFGAKLFVEHKYGVVEDHAVHNPEALITSQADGTHTHNGHIHDAHHTPAPTKLSVSHDMESEPSLDSDLDEKTIQRSFHQQIAAFYILEFGVIFHSVIIGLNLAVAGWEDFKVLYVVIVFHQSFEGLGVGARLSSIPFPRHLSWLPWALCAAYGLTTPLSIAIGLGVRTTYNPDSFTAQIVSGVLDATSAGILLYTGLVELLAADFLFNPARTKSLKRLGFMVACVFLGALLMALLGKWA
ncbi:Zinc/iron permease [Protomyces lactucae-debilis]|uniref:Zinc/iron permease n=1 Tax=Protomyces lactucae-debilis TaxID=2754530 RepID=A0A1Y2FSR7_PROLT|nr:Zinc/iron permease [Protomyces lactucae-debilis]ORY87018.1 Zinc/iron permease [Protomyces lactucae-debilis]